MENSNPLNREPWKVALAIAVFFPLGLYWLWQHPTLGKNKVWWRCAIAYVLFGALLSYLHDDGKSASGPDGLREGMLQEDVLAAMGKPDWELTSKVPGHNNAVMQQRWSRGTGPMGFDPEKSTAVFYDMDGPPPWRVKMILGKGGKSLKEAAAAMQ
jgi:hypothetical protein